LQREAQSIRRFQHQYLCRFSGVSRQKLISTKLAACSVSDFFDFEGIAVFP